MSTSTADDAEEAGGPAVIVEHAPARTSSVVAVIAGLLAALSTATGSVISLVIALLGVGGIAIGLFAVGTRRLTLVGTAVVFVGLLVSGVFGNDPSALLFGAIATFVTFDVSQNAFRVGDQLSTETNTRRGELVHLAATFVVGALAAGVAYSVYLVSASEQPAAALAFLLLCAVLFVWTIRS